MAYQEVNVGTANQGDGDTLRGGGNKINANFSEIYGRFGSGTANASTLEAATSGNILVGNGTKFATTAMSGDATISNTGAVSISKVSLTQGNESGAPSGQSATLAIPRGTEPSTKTDKLYNVNGALYFNGASVGTGSVTGMTGFKVTGDSGGEKDVINGETISILTGSGLTSVASDQQTVTISLDLTTGLTFEGATANAHETTLAVTDPTADRTITLPDATGTVVLKDSTDVFTNKTFDAAGTGNALSNVSNSHISGTAAIAFSKMANLTASRALVSDTNGDVSVSAVTSTEIGYLDGVSSAIQTQLDAKQPTISASARIDAAHIHDGTITNTEFGYLNGVTSNIQTQLDAAGSIVSYAITVADDGGGSQNVYVIEGTAIKTNTHVRKVLYLQKGITYKFDQSHSSNSGHPLRFSVTPDGARNSGSEYTDGVTTAGTPGSSGAYTQIAVKEDAPDILYIYCTNHDNMGGGHDGQDAPIYTSDVGGWRIQTANRTASAGDKLFINSSGNARTITLPAAAAVGDEIEIINLVGTDAHVVDRNGLNINGGTTNGTIDVAQEGLRLVYSNATIGWVATLIESGINTA